jgi:hypothetical protein
MKFDVGGGISFSGSGSGIGTSSIGSGCFPLPFLENFEAAADTFKLGVGVD